MNQPRLPPWRDRATLLAIIAIVVAAIAIIPATFSAVFTWFTLPADKSSLLTDRAMSTWHWIATWSRTIVPYALIFGLLCLIVVFRKRLHTGVKFGIQSIAKAYKRALTILLAPVFSQFAPSEVDTGEFRFTLPAGKPYMSGEYAFKKPFTSIPAINIAEAAAGNFLQAKIDAKSKTGFKWAINRGIGEAGDYKVILQWSAIAKIQLSSTYSESELVIKPPLTGPLSLRSMSQTSWWE